DLTHGAVPHVDFLDHAAAARVGLEAQAALQVRAVHAAVLGEDVPRATRDLAADGHAAVTVLHVAVAYDHVLDGGGEPPAILVASRLQRDAVVPRVEVAVLDEHVAARLRIAAVVVRSVALDANSANGDVLAEHGM